ncbi:MAG: SPFH domain-containing protein [Bacteroidetes bacterium]|nr:SPFH domain-containing protein [Bacteroidota bacterium]MCA0447155.1 SPFH domain-containing protein [Bacteroidota bacterium]
MTQEFSAKTQSGWLVLPLLILLLIADIAGIAFTTQLDESLVPWFLIPLLLAGIIILILFGGFFTLEPNESAVLIFFGKYEGTEKISGFRWTNPFNVKKKLSLRTRNFDSQKLKVNDKKGNPIEISVVVVWKIGNTAQAVFDVENQHEFVTVQAESAIRHVATSYAYDSSDSEEFSLRSSLSEVSEELEKEIQERVKDAGVIISEARINHLAYAPEIAGAMLQRQQAEAIIAARTKIVDGAVGMVQMALIRLKEEGVVDLDEERKAAMISNLLVVLCGDKSTTPIINAGTIY